MTVRITFRSEIYLEGDTLADIKNKFEELPLYNIKDSNGKDIYDYDFVELVSVEDADSYEDIISQWYEI